MTAPAQLVLDLAHLPALNAEDFLVSQSNRAAAETVDRWPDWSHPSILVVAPAGAGKSHLGNVWRLKSGVACLNAQSLREADIANLEHGLLIEDLHAGIGDERVLFHLVNVVRERRLHMLLTSRVPPGELSVNLPDLRSRLRALPVVSISPPDEALLRAVLVKHFSDRQLIVEPHVIGYIALRMERSMETLAALVADLDRAAMASHRKVTRTLAAEILVRYQAIVG
jgi:chromosomal replication initiation ATPase DnaA